MANPPHLALADGAARHVGDPVAFIVADTAAAARDAAELISVDYTVQPSAVDLAKATEPGAPLVWPEARNNIVFDWGIGDQAATDALFASAAHVTRLTVINNRVVVASMEARASIAEFDQATGRWTLYTNTQGGWLIKNLIAAVFATEPEKFRVITPDVGGGFGMKAFLYPGHVLTCYAARKIGQPVKWASERGEAFVADTQGRDNLTTGELAIDKEGKFLALRTRNLANMGAYLSTFAPYIPTLAGGAVCPACTTSSRSLRTSSACSRTRFRWTPTAEPGDRRAITCWNDLSMPRLGNSILIAPNFAAATWCRHRRCRTQHRSARPMTAATSQLCWIRR